MKKWKTISSELAFDHKWFKVRKDIVELPNGKIIDDYYLWPSQDVAMIVPITEENHFVLVKQYKHAAGEIMIEFPAGYAEEGENIADTAKREFTEEAGYSVDTLTPLTTFTNNPTKEISKVFVFLANSAVKVSNQKLDSNEEIELLTVSFAQMLGMIESGEIWNTATVASAFMALKKIGVLKDLIR